MSGWCAAWRDLIDQQVRCLAAGFYTEEQVAAHVSNFTRRYMRRAKRGFGKS